MRRGLLPLQERDHTNALTRSFLWGKSQGGGIGGLLSITDTDTTKTPAQTPKAHYYYLYDGKGHVSTVLDHNRKVKAAYDYSPYGVLIGSAGDPTFTQPYQYSTKRKDAETGIFYFGYRFYLPNEGRWLNRDPIEEMGGLNLYQYVGGDPVNFVDPLGLVETFDHLWQSPQANCDAKKQCVKEYMDSSPPKASDPENRDEKKPPKPSKKPSALLPDMILWCVDRVTAEMRCGHANSCQCDGSCPGKAPTLLD